MSNPRGVTNIVNSVDRFSVKCHQHEQKNLKAIRKMGKKIAESQALEDWVLRVKEKCPPDRVDEVSNDDIEQIAILPRGSIHAGINEQNVGKVICRQKGQAYTK